MEYGVAVRVFSVSQSDSGGHYEHLFLPKALAFLDAFTAPTLVGSKKAPEATRQDQWGLRTAEYHPRVHLRKSRLNICPSKNEQCLAIAPGILRLQLSDG
jgi:hypothetical protein